MLHAVFAMIPTTIQTTRPAQLTDAAFNPIAETLRGAEPRLFFAAAAVGFVAGLGQAHPTHPQGACFLLILGRVNAAIATNLLRRLAKQLAVMLEAGNQARRFVGIADQEPILRNQPAVCKRMS
jgi:hypothetical protein